MRALQAILGFITMASVVANVTADEPKASSTTESAQRVFELARKYEFAAGVERSPSYQLNPKPLLVYSNPVRGDVYGNVFVWTAAGRPEVLGAFFDFRNEGKLDSEIHFLSRKETVGFRNGVPFLEPKQAGIEFRDVPEAAPVAISPLERLRQMRKLAGEFTVERNHPEQGRDELRMLPQPIYRYESGNDNPLDGAIFAFVEATDPEAYLLLEADLKKSSGWRFAFARMNIVEFTARHRDRPVWHVDTVSWDTVFDRHHPYAIIREVPGRGLIRTP